MTFDEILAFARAWSDLAERYRSPDNFDAVARAFVDLLGEALPCGFETPTVLRRMQGGNLVVLRDLDGSFTPSDVRALAAAMLRAADEAEDDGSHSIVASDIA